MKLKLKNIDLNKKFYLNFSKTCLNPLIFLLNQSVDG